MSLAHINSTIKIAIVVITIYDYSKEGGGIVANEKKIYQIGGAAIKLAELKCPVYKKYEIISVVKYVERQNENARQTLEIFVPDFLERINENFGDDTAIIVPDFSQLPEYYDPLEYKESIVQYTMKIYMDAETKGVRENISDENIKSWVEKYGLPYKTARKLRLGIQDDEGDNNDADSVSEGQFFYEKEMEKAFGHYAMFRETFCTLMKEAIGINKGYIAYSKKDSLNSGKAVDEMLEAFNCMASSKQYDEILEILNDKLDEPTSVKNDRLFEVLENRLPGIISERLAGYLKFVSPALLVKPSEKDPQNHLLFEPSWQAFDLWTVMILQIYEYIARNQQYKTCLFCGLEFPSNDPKRKFCPNTIAFNGKKNPIKNARSYCQNAFAVKQYREKRKTQLNRNH